MTVEQWNTLSDDTKQKVIGEALGSLYLAATHYNMNPFTDAVIQYTLSVTTLTDTVVKIDIHKEVKLF